MSKFTMDKLPPPDGWGWTEVRTATIKEGKTVSVLLDIESVTVTDEKMVITGTVKAVTPDTMTDSRLSRQKESIDRLLKHLQHHCPHLIDPSAVCDYQGEEAS